MVMSVVLGGRWVVAQLAVLDDAVGDIDAKARDAAIHPEARDVVEGLANVLVPPVEVGLVGREVVQVPQAAGLVARPCRAPEVAHPVVGRTAVAAFAPHVEVAPLAEPRML